VLQQEGKPVSIAVPGEGGTETLGIPGEGGAEIVKQDKVAVYDRMTRRLEAVAEGLGVGEAVSVQRTDEGILIRIEGNVAFASSKADLRPEALAILDEVAKTVAATPNEIKVGGHTDNVPIRTEQFPSNWELSTARAVAVARYLVEHGRVAPERVFAAGYGEYRPISSNDTSEQRAHNRRAEILIIYPNAPNAEPESAPKGH
jgi:chemotaxis protein MotB